MFDPRPNYHVTIQGGSLHNMDPETDIKEYKKEKLIYCGYLCDFVKLVYCGHDNSYYEDENKNPKKNVSLTFGIHFCMHRNRILDKNAKKILIDHLKEIIL